MMIIEKVIENLSGVSTPTSEEQYSLFQVTPFESEVFYGKNSGGEIVFAITSKNTQARPTLQRTKKLLFWFNANCNVVIDNDQVHKRMSVLTCLSREENEITAFIRLTLAFAEGFDETNSKKLTELFTSLTQLFANEHKAGQVELQGFFGELYAIKYFYGFGLNLNSYWQKKDKLKFDFSISAKKKIEVKTTTKEIRIHHFRHEQLLSDLYEICIISLLLRTSDTGISLWQLVSEVRDIATGNFDTLIYIEDFIRNFDEGELRGLKYDTIYLENNLHLYKAEDVPRFQEDQPKGVSKTEYDSDLSTSPMLAIDEFLTWATVNY